MNEENTKSRDQMLFDLVKNSFNLELSRKEALDSKSSNMLGFIGIIIGVFSSFGLTIEKKIELTFITGIPLFIAILALSLSMALALRAYWPLKYTIVPDSEYLLSEYTDKSWTEILRANAIEFKNATLHNIIQNNDKVFLIKASWIYIFVGLIGLLIFSVSLMI